MAIDKFKGEEANATWCLKVIDCPSAFTLMQLDKAERRNTKAARPTNTSKRIVQ